VTSRVVCTADLPIDMAAAIGEPVERASYADLGRVLPTAEALVCLLTHRIDAALLERAPRLRVVANFAVGFDNVDVAAATRLGVAVANTPDVLTEATADLTFALLLAAARRLGEGERLVRAGAWTGWEPGQLLGADVWGRTLGIVGLGRIGAAVARRGRGFAMPVLYSGSRPHPAGDELGARHVALDELLARADFVSVHCPLSAATHHLIDAAALARMKPTAILVNTARGPIVDEAALGAALAAGTIAGAGLDVFEREPAIDPGLIASDRVVLAPHLGSATTTARRRMGELCASAVRAVLAGERPENLVNPEVWPVLRAPAHPEVRS
jgi:glyoxylate reductase